MLNYSFSFSMMANLGNCPHTVGIPCAATCLACHWHALHMLAWLAPWQASPMGLSLCKWQTHVDCTLNSQFVHNMSRGLPFQPPHAAVGE